MDRKRTVDAVSVAITSWIECNIGGRVVSAIRQPRWRPVYFVDLERDGEILHLCARQARADMPMVFPLRHEMTFQSGLADAGIAVPRVYGWIDDPECYVMDRVPGVPDLNSLDTGQRREVMRAYMRELAHMHTLPANPFKEAGVHHAAAPSESATAGARRFEEIYRRDKIAPDAFTEFVLAWLKRNPGKPSRHEGPVVWDSGQFHQHDGNLISLVDLELGHVGDPMMDLACMRMRDSIIGYGDLAELYEYYSTISGIEVDWDAIRRHHLFFGIANALSTNSARAAPAVYSDYMVNTQWVNETNRYALEDIAALSGIELPDIDPPSPRVHKASVPFRQLTELISSIEPADPVMRNDLRRAFRLSRHLARWGEVGAELEAQDIADVARLAGGSPSDWHESEAALEAFVMKDNGRNDERLIELFNRRLQRAQTLNGPAGSAMNHHHKLQPYPS